MAPVHRLSPRRLFAVIAAVIGLGALAQMTFVWWADPYGARGSAGPKVTALVGGQRRYYKAHDLARVRPDMLICGTSRVEQSFEPGHPALAQQGWRPYVAAMAGSTLYEQYRMVQHAHAIQPLKMVWVELAFLITSARQPRWNPGFSEARLALAADGRTQPLHALADLPLLFALDSQAAAWRTLRHGSSPRRTLAETFDRGHFFPRNLDFSGNNRTSFVRGAQAAWADQCRDFAVADANGVNPHLADLASLITFCRAQGIALSLFLTPEHAYHQWLIRHAGLWPAYVGFKRQALALAGNDVPVWDFSPPGPLTAENLPPATQAGRTMVNYNDGGHYTTAIARRIIQTLADGAATDGFGLRLDAATLDAELAAQEAALCTWAAAHPADAAEVEAMVPSR